MAAAFCHLWQMKELSEKTGSQFLADFRTDWPTYVRLPIYETTVARADDYAWRFGLRGNDAVHLASVDMWQEALGLSVTPVSYDRRLWRAAAAIGLDVLPEEEG